MMLEAKSRNLELGIRNKIMIKKIIFLTAVLIGLTFALPVLAEEQIDNFEATIRINPDSSINVTERIEYDFNSLPDKHGIYRNIPIKYKARGGNYNLRIDDIWVTDENGMAYDFTNSYPGKNIQIKIGDPDQLVTGKKTYLLSYKISRAINFFKDHDELYWNVTGNEWAITIEQARVQIILPKEILPEQLKKDCFAGNYGVETSCSNQTNEISDNNLIRGVLFENGMLSSGEGLTVVIGFPKGLVQEPSRFEIFLNMLEDNGIISLPIFVLGVLLYLWNSRGRDPEGKKTIVAQYEPPDNLSAAEIGTIIDERAHKKDISAQIIHLAVKGYLKINKEDKNYYLEKLRAGEDLPNNFEKKLLESLFDGKTKIKLADLKDKFYKDLEIVKNQIYQATVEKGYFLKNPKTVRTIYAVIGICAIFLSFFTGSFWGGLGVFSLFLSGILIFIFNFFMPKRTKTGVLAKEHILGLKVFLTVAEKERLKFHNAPEKKPQLFEKLLPFAMVLGVEKQWAKQFEGIYQGNPSWYNDPSGGTFSSFLLINSLSNFQSKANATLASRPSSASSGGSGFGGGGFSGGGFGGGGGGSW